MEIQGAAMGSVAGEQLWWSVPAPRVWVENFEHREFKGKGYGEEEAEKKKTSCKIQPPILDLVG